MSIYVTRAPTVPLTSYDTKRSSHLKLKRDSRWTFYVLRINSYHFKRLFGHETRCCSTSSEKPEFSSKTQLRKGQKLNEYVFVRIRIHRTTTVFTWYGSGRLFFSFQNSNHHFEAPVFFFFDRMYSVLYFSLSIPILF